MSSKLKKYIKKALSSAKRLIKGGFLHILSGNVLNKAISMISSVVIAKLVSKTDYAYLSYADTLYSYISLLSGMGLSTAILKFCSPHNPDEENKAYLSYAATRGSAFELLASLVLCVAVTFADIPYPNARMYVWALCLYPFIHCIFLTVTNYIRTLRENKRYAKSAVLQSLSVCLLSIGFVLIFDAVGIVAARYAGAVIALIYLLPFVVKKLGGIKPSPIPNEKKKALWKMSISLMVANLFSSMMPLNEAFLVDNMIRDEIITANFKVAGIFPRMLLLVAGAITVYFFPVVAQTKDWREIRKKTYKIGVFTAIFMFFVAAAGVALTPVAIRLLYGQKYVDAIEISYILWAMRAVNCCLRFVPGNMLPAVGRTKFNAWVAAISCGAQILLDYLFIKKFGIYGVAYGTIIVHVVSGIAYWVYFSAVCKKEIALQDARAAADS